MSDVLSLPLPAQMPADNRQTQLHHLLARCLAGEENGYASLYNFYATEIYRLCYGLLQHPQDAEEVLQDTFEYAFRRLHTYQPHKSAFRTWLYRIAISRCHNKRRRKWLPTFSFQDLFADELTDKNTPDPMEMADLSIQKQEVWEALKQLSPKLRETVILRYYDGLAYAEIGEILDIPAKTVESRMRLAHKALKELLLNS